MFDLKQIIEYSGTLCFSGNTYYLTHSFCFFLAIELVDLLGWNIWLIRSVMWQGFDTKLSNLGRSFNQGQVQFPHLWKERIGVLWKVIFNFMNLLVSSTFLVKTYNLLPFPILFYQGRGTNAYVSILSKCKCLKRSHRFSFFTFRHDYKD